MAKNIYGKLADIQSELFVPKGKKNEFGGFVYRSCEDILKQVKPLVAKNGCALFINNKTVAIGDRTYVEAEVTLYDTEANGHITVTAQAREPLSKKGMDEMQVTGATSSYARKYALAGMFCIDNEKDADDMDNRGEGQRPSKPAAKPVAAKPTAKLTTAQQAWYSFKEKTANMSDEARVEAWGILIRETLAIPAEQKLSTKTLTEDQWKKIIAAIAA